MIWRHKSITSPPFNILEWQYCWSCIHIDNSSNSVTFPHKVCIWTLSSPSHKGRHIMMGTRVLIHDKEDWWCQQCTQTSVLCTRKLSSTCLSCSSRLLCAAWLSSSRTDDTLTRSSTSSDERSKIPVLWGSGNSTAIVLLSFVMLSEDMAVLGSANAHRRKHRHKQSAYTLHYTFWSHQHIAEERVAYWSIVVLVWAQTLILYSLLINPLVYKTSTFLFAFTLTEIEFLNCC